MGIPHFQKNGNLLTLKITSSINDSSFRKICGELEQDALNGPLRMILIVHHYPSFNSAEDLYYDLRFVKLYADRIRKVAVVSDQNWKQTWVALFGLFAGVSMEFFDVGGIHQAVEWVRGD